MRKHLDVSIYHADETFFVICVERDGLPCDQALGLQVSRQLMENRLFQKSKDPNCS
jgi:hypothetical protein